METIVEKLGSALGQSDRFEIIPILEDREKFNLILIRFDPERNWSDVFRLEQSLELKRSGYYLVEQNILEIRKKIAEDGYISIISPYRQYDPIVYFGKCEAYIIQLAVLEMDQWSRSQYQVRGIGKKYPGEHSVQSYDCTRSRDWICFVE